MAHITMVLPNSVVDRSKKIMDSFQYITTCTNVYQIFTQAGFSVTVSSPSGGPVGDGRRNEGEGEQSSSFHQTVPIHQIEPTKTDGIFLIGKHQSLLDFSENRCLLELIFRMLEMGKSIATVAHAAAVFTELYLPDGTPLVEGKRVTAFTNEEEERYSKERTNIPFYIESKLRERGATFVSAPPFHHNVEVHHNIITAQNLQSAPEAAYQFLGRMETRQLHEN
ncbi:type 1 glutamine amidotransferase domain-containing protein [Alteribacillus iranensis]|uniref:Putative intracellular protease/amidase n=1 Tax=Alteribacillus iranensis TaxID=930128 RepID=A0A1I1ZWN4_9BACI|nr:type 1 glutamine amidotransferase domain-containing protein [Alteribacillus iranensis]SFE35987.1 Putative intracellular protease/amidase [Alteribacillus iranensis]